MSDVLEKVKAEIDGGRSVISEEELIESLSMLDDLAEFIESSEGNTKSIKSAIKGLAILWAMLFDDETEVKINDR